MTSTELIRSILKKLGRYKLIVAICGIGMGILLFFYAKTKRPVYTAQATVFPLTAPSDNSLSSSALNGILGIEGTPKSFSNEAAINIIELSSSRNLREKVAAGRVKEFDNKTVTELLVEDMNQHLSFLGKPIILPKDSLNANVIGAQLLKNAINVKMSKNGVLEIYFSSTAKDIITPVTYIFINKLSQFYIDLKVTKALADYNFTVKRIDSFQDMLNNVDNRAVKMQNSTFFTPMDKLEYNIPKENLSMEKSRVLRQRDMSVNNREEATWRLQKATPIISVLDTPTEPFTVVAASPKVYAVIGFIAGCLLTALLLISGLIIRFAKAEIHKSFFEEEPEIPLSL